MGRLSSSGRTAGVAAILGLAVGLPWACGSPTLKAEGEECYASTECEDGLTCDFGVMPHVCAHAQTDASPPDAYVPPPPDAGPDARPRPDGGETIDAAPIDAAPIDAAPIDATPIDAAPPIDAEEPDAT